MAIQRALGCPPVDRVAPERLLPQQGFHWLPIRYAHLLAAAEPESDGLHRDPLHRLLGCQRRVDRCCC